MAEIPDHPNCRSSLEAHVDAGYRFLPISRPGAEVPAAVIDLNVVLDEDEVCHVHVMGPRALCGGVIDCAFEEGDPLEADVCAGCSRLICPDCRDAILGAL